jgi:hypothetical protein
MDDKKNKNINTNHSSSIHHQLSKILKFFTLRQQQLQLNIQQANEIFYKNLMKNINHGYIPPEYRTVTDNEILLTNKQHMEREYDLIDAILHGVTTLTKEDHLQNIPFLLNLQHTISYTTENFVKKDNIEIHHIQSLETFIQMIEDVIGPHIPQVHLLQLPCILIDAGYNDNTSIYTKIYHYLIHTLQLSLHNIQVYNECITTYKKTHKYETDDELMRWTVPRANLTTETEILTSLIEQFQQIFNTFEHPTSQQIMSINNDRTIDFYEQLNNFLTEQLQQLQTKLKHLTSHKTSDKTYLDNHKMKMYALEINKLQEYINEIGLAYAEILTLQQQQYKKFKEYYY